MDEEKRPADILDEIWNRSKERPAPTPCPPKFAPPPEAPSREAALLPWLCLLLAVVAAALTACLFQLSGVRARLASLEEAVGAVTAMDQLREENLSLVNERNRLAAWADQKSEEVRQLTAALDDAHGQRIERRALYSLWYLQQFMARGDYFLAAAEVAFSTEFWRGTWEEQIALNPALLEQYDATRQELIDRGYLQQLDHFRDGGTDIYFTDRWDPSQNRDAAKLSILWCVLEAHFVQENGQAASQYLSNTVLASPDTDLAQAGSFALEQLQNAKDDLVESSWLTVDKDGNLHEGFGPDGAKPDILYNLPFKLPAQMILYG